jgi:hypothetical protein
MTKIMFFSFNMCIATLAWTACQLPDEPLEDTDTTPECGEDETAVVLWCESADQISLEFLCLQCGQIDACEYEFELDFVCGQLSANYGKLRDCVNKEDAAHCQAEMLKNICEEEIYHWEEQCVGFSL